MPTTKKLSSSPSKPRAQAATALRNPYVSRLDAAVFDIKVMGREIRQSKETALAFLIKAGILNKKGVLAKPYRD